MPFIGNKPSAVPLTSADIADGIITSAKIVDGTIVNADINASAAIASTKLSGVANTPAFQATLGSAQSLTDSVLTKLQFNTESFDTNSNYDNATNYRFTPTTAGKYFVYLALTVGATATNNVQEGSAVLRKNGTSIQVVTTGNYANNTLNAVGVTATSVVDFNGSTDYVEAFGRVYGSGTLMVFTGTNSFFGAYKLIGV